MSDRARDPIEAALEAPVEIDGRVWRIRQCLSCYSDEEACAIERAAIAAFLRARAETRRADLQSYNCAAFLRDLAAEVERGEQRPLHRRDYRGVTYTCGCSAAGHNVAARCPMCGNPETTERQPDEERG